MLGGKRITILSKDEYEFLYGIPELTNKDRIVLFDLSEADRKEINKLSTACPSQVFGSARNHWQKGSDHIFATNFVARYL